MGINIELLTTYRWLSPNETSIAQIPTFESSRQGRFPNHLNPTLFQHVYYQDVFWGKAIQCEQRRNHVLNYGGLHESQSTYDVCDDLSPTGRWMLDWPWSCRAWGKAERGRQLRMIGVPTVYEHLQLYQARYYIMYIDIVLWWNWKWISWFFVYIYPQKAE